MVLRVTQVDTPAAGQEWSFAIPGQYVYDVRSIVATYEARDSAGSATLVDSSIHGHNGTTTGPRFDLGLQYPGAIAGDAAYLMGDWPPLANYLYSQVGPTGAGARPFNLQDIFSLECWVKFITPGNTVGALVICQTSGGVERIYLQIPDSTDLYVMLTWSVTAGAYKTANHAFPDDGQWHHLVGVGLNGVGHIYVDGVEKPSTPFGAPGASDPNNANMSLSGDFGGGAHLHCALDEVAVYEYDLDAGQVAAHYAAAAGGIAAYSAAVLPDDPEGYYHLDETMPFTPAERYSALEVGDGTHNVATYTSGLLSSLTGPVTFVWTPGTSTVTDTGDQIVIGVPPLILNGGYTLESATPGLAATDQWSNIAIWWDDALSPLPGAGRSWQYKNVMLLG